MYNLIDKLDGTITKKNLPLTRMRRKLGICQKCQFHFILIFILFWVLVFFFNFSKLFAFWKINAH
jgi:hypothetical protein